MEVFTGERRVAGDLDGSNPPAVAGSGEAAEWRGNLAVWSPLAEIPEVELPETSGELRGLVTRALSGRGQR